MGRSQGMENRESRVPDSRPPTIGSRLKAVLRGVKWLLGPESFPRSASPDKSKTGTGFFSWLLAPETMPCASRSESVPGSRGGSWLLGFEPMPTRRPRIRNHGSLLGWLLRPEPFPTRKHSEAKHGSR